MSTVVSKSSPMFIGPCEPTPSSNINLSTFDKCFAGWPVTCFLVFDHPIHQPAESIKRALSQALVHYQPVAGRLEAAAKDGEITIACTGEGVLFVSARANCTLENLSIAEPPSEVTLKDLAICSSDGPLQHTDPLLLIQVTEFTCGGFIIGATWNHVIADAEGMAQLLQAVGELVRGLSRLSVIPVRCDESLSKLSPLAIASNKLIGSMERLDLASVDITIPLSLIIRIKAEFDREVISHQPCTVVEATMAVLWQCRTRVTMSDPNTPTLLNFAVNLRRHVSTKDGYYGNCSIGQVVSAASGEVANGRIIDVVNLIKGAKDMISKMCKNDNVNQPTSRIGMEHHGLLSGYNVLHLSSWRNLGFDAVDLGCGGPARVMCHIEGKTLPTCFICPPCKGKDVGVNVMSRCVKKNQAKAFREELERFMRQMN
ncbi:hypothetical protein ACP70R_012085 [Stipagrostis hirtigluma subsp. patula]